MSSRGKRSGRSRLIAAGAFGLLLIGFVAYLSLTAQNGLPWARYYVVHADLADAGNLDTYDDVRIAGRRVGQVSAIHYAHGEAQVTLQIDSGDAPLRAGTTVRVRLNGLIGAKFVQITPSLHGRDLPSGATIGLSATSTNPDLFDVLSALGPSQIADLRATLRGLGEGFLGRGTDLNIALADSPPLLRAADPLLGALNAEPQAVRSLIPSLDALADAVAPARENIADGFAPEARSLQPLVTHDASVQATLEAAPGAETAVTRQVPAIDELLAQTNGLAAALRALTRPAPVALTDTGLLLRAAPGPIRNATGLLDAAVPLVPAALRLTGRIDPLATPLGTMLANTIPLLTQIGLRGCDLINAADWLRGAASFGQQPDGPLGPHNVVRVLEAENADDVQGGPVPASTSVRVDTDPAPCSATADRVPEP